MKKRKELNALIGLGGDSKRKKTKKGSGHRLLRTEPPDSDSESTSEDDEYSGLSGVAAFGKRSYTQCCAICYPLCVFIVLAACVMACAGLIWMQIALKEDLDSLKEKLHTMESSQSVSSHEIPKLNEGLKEEQKRLELIENGERGLGKLWSNLTEINRKISLLDSVVSHLKANIKSASDLITLPTTVEELQKSVATIGSTLTSLQHDVTTIETKVEDHKKMLDGLKKTTVEQQNKEDKELNNKSASSVEKADGNCSACLPLKQAVQSIQDGVREMNVSLALYQSQADDRIRSLSASIGTLTQKVSFLENGFLLFNTTLPPRRNDSRAEVARERFQLISALTSKADSEGPQEHKGVNVQQQLASDNRNAAHPGSLLGPGAVGQGIAHPPDPSQLNLVEHVKDSQQTTPQQSHNGSTAHSGTGLVAVGDGTTNVRLTSLKGPSKEEVNLPNAEPPANATRGSSLSQSSKPTRRPRFLSQRILKKVLSTEQPSLVTFPGISSLKDLENVFHNFEVETSAQGLSYDELKEAFGAGLVDAQLLEQFDEDGNRRFSLTELQTAAGL